MRKQDARGKRLFKVSGHMDSHDIDLMDNKGKASDQEDSDTDSNEQVIDEAVKAQDFHTMLSFALKSFVRLQRSGFLWDQKAHGTLCKGVHFIPIVINVNCDSEEGDLLCAKYTVRTNNVKHICRYCHCPTKEADDFRGSCLLYTSPSPRDLSTSRMPSSA